MEELAGVQSADSSAQQDLTDRKGEGGAGPRVKLTSRGGVDAGDALHLGLRRSQGDARRPGRRDCVCRDRRRKRSQLHLPSIERPRARAGSVRGPRDARRHHGTRHAPPGRSPGLCRSFRSSLRSARRAGPPRCVLATEPAARRDRKRLADCCPATRSADHPLRPLDRQPHRRRLDGSDHDPGVSHYGAPGACAGPAAVSTGLDRGQCGASRAHCARGRTSRRGLLGRRSDGRHIGVSDACRRPDRRRPLATPDRTERQ